MARLEDFQARLCQTACGFLISKERVLLVLHKKLNIWLAPGGHVEGNELPHRAAEREFKEETGIRVTAVSAYPMLSGSTSDYLPLPLAINLHWISQTRYHQRVKSQVQKPGCEQHWVMAYLVKPVGGTAFKKNDEETTDIRWFKQEEIPLIATTDDIKQEINLAFSLERSGRQGV